MGRQRSSHATNRVGMQIGWQAGRRADRRIDWQQGRQAGRSADRLGGRQAGREGGRLTRHTRRFGGREEDSIVTQWRHVKNSCFCDWGTWGLFRIMEFLGGYGPSEKVP